MAAKRVTAERKRAREESERIRLAAEGDGDGSLAVTTAGVLGGADIGSNTSNGGTIKPEEGGGTNDKKGDSTSSLLAEQQKQQQTRVKEEQTDEDDDSIDENEPIVAIFGEIVEDPTLMLEDECDDPNIVRENVKRLNQSVLRGFLKLVQKLVHDPNDNKLSSSCDLNFICIIA